MSAKKAGAASTMSSATVTIRLDGGRSLKSTQVWNISLGGVFIEMSEPLKFGSDASFEFALGPGVGTIRCKGFVIWSTKDSPDKGKGKDGIAVRLTDLGVSQMRSIAEVVRREL